MTPRDLLPLVYDELRKLAAAKRWNHDCVDNMRWKRLTAVKVVAKTFAVCLVEPYTPPEVVEARVVGVARGVRSGVYSELHEASF